MSKRRIAGPAALAAELKARGIPVSPSHLSRIVSGQLTHLRVDLFAALCAVLECSPADLLVVEHAPAERRPRDRKLPRAVERPQPLHHKPLSPRIAGERP